MILLMATKAQYECDAIRINLLPQKFADDSSSMESKQEIVQLARQMGSYIVTMKRGVVESFIDPNQILAVLPTIVNQGL